MHFKFRNVPICFIFLPIVPILFHMFQGTVIGTCAVFNEEVEYSYGSNFNSLMKYRKLNVTTKCEYEYVYLMYYYNFSLFNSFIFCYEIGVDHNDLKAVGETFDLQHGDMASAPAQYTGQYII